MKLSQYATPSSLTTLAHNIFFVDINMVWMMMMIMVIASLPAAFDKVRRNIDSLWREIYANVK